MSLPEVALWPEELRNGRILVVHQGALGDLILTLPAIKALRHALEPRPHAQHRAWLEMMGHPWILALVRGRPYADAIIDVNRGDMAPFFRKAAPLPPGMQRYLQGFDCAFCFSRSETLACNLLRAGIKQSYTLPSFPDKKMHVIDHHLSALKAVGIPAISTSPMIYLSYEERQEAERFLRNQGWDLDTIIAIHPGAGSRKKAWPAARFAALARLLASTGHKILIIKGPADEAAAQEVVKGLGRIPYLLVCDLPITKLAALLSYASLVIGNDSGVSHLAAALKIPTIAIFGPTDPYVWAPRSDRAFWLQGQAVCAPCTWEEQRLCERQQCLDSIQVDQVMALIAEKGMLGNRATLLEGRSDHRDKRTHPYGETGISVPSP
jgi:ADP-heptose:LPS heptosyltransferase